MCIVLAINKKRTEYCVVRTKERVNFSNANDRKVVVDDVTNFSR